MATDQPLDSLQPKPKSAAEYNAETIASSPDSAQILANLQRRAAELSSPWNAFQSGLDEMVARTAYHPESGIAMLGEKRAKEANELQNIGMLTAQADMLKQQLGTMRSGFQQAGTPPQAGSQAPVQGGQTSPAAARGQDSGYTYNGVPLSIYDYQNLKNYADTNDLAGFKAAFKSISDAQGKAKAESQYNWSRMDMLENVPILAPDGRVYRVTTSKEDYARYKANPLDLPPALGGSVDPNYPGPKVQGKANGGAVRHLAGGGSPMDASVAPVPELTPPPQDSAPVEQAPAPIAQAAPRGSMAEDIISLLSGSSNAQAQTPPRGNVTVQGWKPPAGDWGQSDVFQKQGQQSGLQQEQQTNEAQLKSLQEERTAAGKFIADLQNQSFSPTTVQNAQEIIDMATKNPEYFGYGYKKDPVGFLMKLTGRTEDTQGEAGQRETGMLTNMKEFFAGEDAMVKRSRLDNLAKQLGIAYEKEQFGGTGSKMGAQLTTISQAAKGLSSKYPPEQNIAQALTVQVVHERNSEIAKEWDKYKSTVKNPDPYTFMNSPKVQGIINRWNLELTNKVDKIMNKPADGTKDTDKNGNPIVWQNGQPMRVKQ